MCDTIITQVPLGLRPFWRLIERDTNEAACREPPQLHALSLSWSSYPTVQHMLYSQRFDLQPVKYEQFARHAWACMLLVECVPGQLLQHSKYLSANNYWAIIWCNWLSAYRTWFNKLSSCSMPEYEYLPSIQATIK